MDEDAKRLLQGMLRVRYAQLKTRTLLEQTPDLIVHVLAQVVPGGGAQGARVSGSKEIPLPLNAVALEDANGLYVGLIKWAIGHSRALKVQPPAIALGWSRKEQNPDGLPSWATSEDAHGLMHSIVDWLNAYEDQIAQLTIASVYWDSVKEIVEPILKRYPTAPPKRIFASRDCQLCGKSRTMIVDHNEQTDEVTVACTYCGYVVPHQHRAKYLEWKNESAA